ncbi:hypothetical protein LTR29_013038 [Friedmanniomyces endolithicus]|nr:hypothetical protein LTR29_013038 [Friedmanniomyces endolithicus]
MSANDNTPAKTPAQMAKPYGTAAAAAASKAKKAEPAAPESAAQNDSTKAIEKLEHRSLRLTAGPSNANNIARVANSQLTANDEKLLPLVSLKTGKPMEKFPATSKDIEKLGLTYVDAILNGLEADRAGNEAVKKERLRLQIGLKPNPA